MQTKLKKTFQNLPKPERKFTADIAYGMLASGSCLLTDICDHLYEPSKKINVVGCLSQHLEKGIPASSVFAYLQQVKKWLPAEPVVYIDDSDVVKPDGYKFEALGIVRDGSESMPTKNVYKKGYHVTEACTFTSGNHPVSIFSKIHSSHEKDYKSANTVTFQAIERGVALFGKTTFAMDRGNDDNKMFRKLDGLGQDYIIRLKSNRKLLYHNKWTAATELCNRRKGKAKTSIFYKGKNHEVYLSHVKVQVTASRRILTWCLFMAFLVMVSVGSEVNALKVSIIKAAYPVREKVFFSYYHLAKGISGMLFYAKEGIRLWFRTKRPVYRQLCFKTDRLNR